MKKEFKKTEKKVESNVEMKNYFYPDHNISIKASSKEEADKKLNARLGIQSNTVSSSEDNPSTDDKS